MWVPTFMKVRPINTLIINNSICLIPHNFVTHPCTRFLSFCVVLCRFLSCYSFSASQTKYAVPLHSGIRLHIFPKRKDTHIISKKIPTHSLSMERAEVRSVPQCCGMSPSIFFSIEWLHKITSYIFQNK